MSFVIGGEHGHSRQQGPRGGIRFGGIAEKLQGRPERFFQPKTTSFEFDGPDLVQNQMNQIANDGTTPLKLRPRLTPVSQMT